jgi:TatA/E family protein of Tat protein translocase
MNTPLAFLTATQAIIVFIVGVLLFGRRLPELGFYLVKGIREFKRGLQGGDDGS